MQPSFPIQFCRTKHHFLPNYGRQNSVLLPLLEESKGGQPGGAAVKCARFTSQWPRVHWFGSWVQTRHHLARHAVVGVSHIKQRKMGTDVSSRPGFLSKKRKTGSSQLRANLPQKKKYFKGTLDQNWQNFCEITIGTHFKATYFKLFYCDTLNIFTRRGIFYLSNCSICLFFLLVHNIHLCVSIH